MNTRCPFCKAEHDMIDPVMNDDDTPEPGDITLCFSCGEWCIFDPHWTGGLRKPTYAEYSEIVTTEIFHRMRKVWLIVKQNTGN